MGEFNADLDRGKLGHAAAAAILSRLAELDEVLGIMNQPQAAAAPDAEIDARVQAREEARKRRDWAAADQIRQELAAQGIDLTDTPAGPRWRRQG